MRIKKFSRSLKISKISNDSIIYYSLIIIIFLVSLPITIILPSIIRIGLQIVSVGMFGIGLMIRYKGRYLFPFLFLIAITIIYYMVVWRGLMSAFTFGFNAVCCWVFCIAGIYYMREQDSAHMNQLLRLVILLSVLTALTTILGTMRYPLAIRELGKAADYLPSNVKFLYRRLNIAGWSQLYGILTMVPINFMMWKKTKEKIYIISGIVCEICVICSQITFAMLMSFILLFFALFKFPGIRKRKDVLLWLCIIFGGIFCLINMNLIIQLLVNITAKINFDTLSIKLQDLYNLLQYKTSTGDALARFNLYGTSINTFLKYPLGGSIISKVDPNISFGHHSDFFDLLGCFGLPGILVICILIVIYFSIVNNRFGKVPKEIILMFVAFIGMMIFNPVLYSPQIFLGVFLLPILLCCIGNR